MLKWLYPLSPEKWFTSVAQSQVSWPSLEQGLSQLDRGLSLRRDIVYLCLCTSFFSKMLRVSLAILVPRIVQYHILCTSLHSSHTRIPSALLLYCTYTIAIGPTLNRVSALSQLQHRTFFERSPRHGSSSGAVTCKIRRNIFRSELASWWPRSYSSQTPIQRSFSKFSAPYFVLYCVQSDRLDRISAATPTPTPTPTPHPRILL